MNSTFKKVALASALLASSALVAPQAALAASAGVAATTTAGTASAFNAPFTTAFQAAYGMRATISITVDGTATNVDRYELAASSTTPATTMSASSVALAPPVLPRPSPTP